MGKKEFLEQLSKKLSVLPKNEREERLAFYSEMIDDRIEEGLTEAAAVASIGFVELPEEKPATKRRLTAWKIVLLVLGSPIWFSLLIAAFSLVLSLYISLWAVIVSLWAAFGSLVACSASIALGGIGFAIDGHVPTGLAMLGAGLVCGGLSIGFFYGCHWITKGTVLLTKKLMAWSFRKEKAL